MAEKKRETESHLSPYLIAGKGSWEGGGEISGCHVFTGDAWISLVRCFPISQTASTDVGHFKDF